VIAPLLLACLSAPVTSEDAGATPAMVEAEAGPAATTLRAAFPPPAGAERVDGGDFGAWLGALALADAGEPVRTFDGREVGHDARVIALPLVSGDLQQCADSAIRLRAEWLRETGGEVMYHATSGDPIPWSRWAGGERPYAEGNALAWTAGGDGSWEGYLRAVFMYAGTRSLALDTDPAADPRPGDLLVQPGSPGHAVVLLDVARGADALYVLVGEGYMPAQSFHVELGPEGGWWRWQDGVALPHWTLPASGLRRWKR
jgi:hypothetical protein